MTRKVRLVLFVMLCLASAALAETRVQALYKTTRMSNSTVAVSCRSGAVPDVQKFGDSVVVSCK